MSAEPSDFHAAVLATAVLHPPSLAWCDVPVHAPPLETMHPRIRLLRLAAAALALTTSRRCSVCARSTTAAATAHTAAAARHNGRQDRTHTTRTTTTPDITPYGQKCSRQAAVQQLSSKRLSVEDSSTATAPWLTSLASLRGGGRAGAPVDVPRGGGGGAIGAVAFTGVRRSATVSHYEYSSSTTAAVVVCKSHPPTTPRQHTHAYCIHMI